MFPGTDVSVDCCSALSPCEFNRLALFQPTGWSSAGELTAPDGATTNRALATAPGPIRLSTASRVGSTRAADPHPFNDPCKYLG